jgi:hypothetical protein
MLENKINNPLDQGIIKEILIPNKKIKTLKSGEVKEYVYDQKPYNDKYYNKNKETINKKILCEVCNKIIFVNNLDKHNTSIKHIKIDLINKLNKMNNTNQPTYNTTNETKCDCGSIYANKNKRYHITTKKHNNYMNSIEEKIIDNIIKEEQTN